MRTPKLPLRANSVRTISCQHWTPGSRNQPSHSFLWTRPGRSGTKGNRVLCVQLSEMLHSTSAVQYGPALEGQLSQLPRQFYSVNKKLWKFRFTDESRRNGHTTPSPTTHDQQEQASSSGSGTAHGRLCSTSSSERLAPVRRSAGVGVTP